MIFRKPVKKNHYSGHILIRLRCSGNIFEKKLSYIRFHENPPVEDRQKDRQIWRS